VSVDGLLPDDVVRARDGELAPEPRLSRQFVVADDAVHNNVVRPVALVRGHGGLAVVELAEKGEERAKISSCSRGMEVGALTRVPT
jgi:hypothetical protein